ncbi:DUF1588 domain-containing protein [Alienimonas chondri]|uniref:DUF1592 domain-containing protein n=1 Tax=Alienimonas chondri TaxID=2681879 RepID=A0ABX1VA50_9PLAN|nr:DUF1588 domain-containing protein [Alienimonas chondri]NNJ24969.1 hypothetical protein [Alienimonas chondri]
MALIGSSVRRFAPVSLLAVVAALCSAAVGQAADETPAPAEVRAYLEANCGDCHANGSAEGGFELSSLPDDPTLQDAGRWDRVHDRIRDGEMPPPDYDELNRSEKREFLSDVSRWLAAKQHREIAEAGRSRGRRLTALQLERSLQSVLGIDTPLSHLLPPDRRHHGFTTVTEGGLSHHDLAAHLEVVDAALDEAFARALSSDETWTKELSAKDLARRNPRSRTREPELFKEMAVTWQTRLVYVGRLPVTTSRDGGGWYRFTFDAEALKAPPEGLWCTVRTGQLTSSAPTMADVGTFLVTDQRKTYAFEAWLPEGHMFEVRPNDQRLKQGSTPGGQVGAGEMQPQNVAGLGIHHATLTRFHRGLDDASVRERLFGDVEVNWVKNPRRGRGEPAGSFQPQPRNARGAIASLMRAFADRAFRRHVDSAALAPYIAAAQNDLAGGKSFTEALRAGYRSLLCSPRFLYHVEEPGELDGPALASRLSYFLTGAPPDAELTTLGESGEILKDDVLREQTERLLTQTAEENDRYGVNGLDRFVEDFAHEWLDLSELDATEVTNLYPNWDPTLQISMRDEAHALLRTMLADDLSVTHVVDGDFAFVNERLADQYDLPLEQKPEAWRQENDGLTRVDLPSDSPRGGLLTLGAILKLTADGAATSPVLRGVWASERLLGITVPPPPENVPAVEPDTRGARTIREQLAKHRADPSCASCHVKVDPVGFALESFDPAGAYRDSYMARRKGKIVPRAPIDPSYDMPDGRSFEDIVGFQQLAAGQPDDLAANLARHLLTYATGAPPSFADRRAIDDIVWKSRDDGFGTRSLLHACIQSPLFRSK